MPTKEEALEIVGNCLKELNGLTTSAAAMLELQAVLIQQCEPSSDISYAINTLPYLLPFLRHPITYVALSPLGGE